jgi:hypothetical protein
MIEHPTYDLLRVALRLAIRLWPLWLFWFICPSSTTGQIDDRARRPALRSHAIPWLDRRELRR